MSKKEGKYIRYYPRNQISKKDKEILDFLRQDTPRAIILILFAYIECSLSEISKNLEKHPSTISYHLKNMKEMDIVEQVIVKNGIIQKKSIKLTIKRSQISNETVYMLKDPVSIYNLLVRYRYNLFDNVTIGCIVDYFNDFVAEGIPDKILSPKDSIDSIVKKINELFPPPFCA